MILGYLLTACSAQKRVWYVQDTENFTPEAVAEAGQIRIKPLDRLTIVVNSRNPELAVPFNSSTSYNSLTGSPVTGTSGQQSLQVRTVDEEGRLEMPVIGTVECSGLTRSELARRIAEDLSPEWAAEADRPEFAEYIASFAGNGGAGLYIHGGVGAGKTHAASAMARLFAEAGYDVAFTTAKGMLERVKATFDEGGTEAAVARYAKCDVLVLDDLGKEDATEWSVGTVFSVLDARYEDMRPTIVTSNYAPGALADRLARRGERVTAEAIASRISQTCRPVYLGGRDRRRRG